MRAAKREVVLRDEAVPADDHPTPLDAAQLGCGWPVARTITAEPALAQRLLRGGPRDRRRRQGAAGPRLLRAAARQSARRPRRSSWPWPPTPGTPTTTSAAATSTPAAPACRSSGRWRGATCTSRRATGAGSPSRQRDDPTMNAHVGYLRLNHLSPWAGSAGWPDWELPVPAVGRARGLRHRRRAPTPTSRTTRRCSTATRCYLSVGHDEYWSSRDARHRRGAHRRRRATPPSSPATPRSGRCASRTTTPEGPAATMVGYKGAVQERPGVGHATASASSRASGRSRRSAAPRTR